MKAPEPPNISPKPTSQKTGVPMQKSMRFFIRMLPVFLARVNPASHMANPACMKKTRAAPTRTQMVLTAEYVIVIPPSNDKGANALSAFAPLRKAQGAAGLFPQRLCCLWAQYTPLFAACQWVNGKFGKLNQKSFQSHGYFCKLIKVNLHFYNTTGTGIPMVRVSGVTVHSIASTCTPAAAAWRRAAPNSGWVASLGAKSFMPAI